MIVSKRKFAIVFAPFDAGYIGSLQSVGRIVTLYPTMKAAREEARRLDKVSGIETGAYRAIVWPEPLYTEVKADEG